MKASLTSLVLLASLLATGACGQQGTLAQLQAQQAAAAVSVPGTDKIDPRTSKVVASTAGTAVALPYALYNVSGGASTPTKKYVLTTSTYNLCGWGALHGWAGHPNLSSILALYLLNETGGTVQAPITGTYQVATPPQGATGLFIDPTVSGYGVFAQACDGSWPGLASGSVTIGSIDGSGVMAGTASLVLNDGTTLQGDFTTASCTGREIDGTDGKSTDCNW